MPNFRLAALSVAILLIAGCAEKSPGAAAAAAGP
jgi:hypothetical protein